MRGLAILLAALLAAAFTPGVASAQMKKDTVILNKKVGDRKEYSGRVLSEDWKTTELDTDGDGRADKTFQTADVDHIEYNVDHQPKYMVEAKLLKTKDPKQYMEKLSRAYNDDATPKFVLQHAYYNIARTATDLAKTEPAMAASAIDAWQKLFARVPDTRYSIAGRQELGAFLLAQGKNDAALKAFKELADGPYGPAVAQSAKMMMARTEMESKHYPEAERLLTQAAAGIKLTDTEALQEVKMLQCRAIIGQKRLDDAYAMITATLGEKAAPNKTLGMLYSVMGDYFAAKGNYKAALTAYLKVPLMYPETDAVEKASSIRLACSMLEKLGRGKEVEGVKKLAGE